MPKYIELSAQTEIDLSELFSSSRQNKEEKEETDKGDDE